MKVALKRPNNNDEDNKPIAGLAVGVMFVVYLIYCAGYNMGASDNENYGELYESTVSRRADAVGIATGEQSLTALASETMSNPLGIPQGEAEALPSIRVENTAQDVERGRYGGEGDKQHLGGFTQFDGMGVSPAVWRHMISNLGVKSMMDVGCGKGVSTLYFAEHGVDVLCLEGSHDAVSKSLLPDPENQIVEHDFSRGPYWPGETYDAVWSVEFLEHVGRNFQYNYIQAFRKAAYIFVSHSKWGGWHHVEVHEQEWWITRFESFGFRYSQILTDEIREVAKEEREYCKNNLQNVTNLNPVGKPYNAQHVWLTMMVFINPAVAALPQHAHLMAEPGCFKDKITATRTTPAKIIHRDCNLPSESHLPPDFVPLKLTPQMHDNWLTKVKASLN